MNHCEHKRTGCGGNFDRLPNAPLDIICFQMRADHLYPVQTATIYLYSLSIFKPPDDYVAAHASLSIPPCAACPHHPAGPDDFLPHLKNYIEYRHATYKKHHGERAAPLEKTPAHSIERVQTHTCPLHHYTPASHRRPSESPH
jgi:hypothetical protein